MRTTNTPGVRARVPGPAALLLALALLALTLLTLAGCSDDASPPYAPRYSQTPAVNRTFYVFAPHPVLNPQKLAEAYGVMLDRLNLLLAPDNITLALEASRDYATYNQKLLRRSVHFALPNPYQAWLAQQCGYLIIGKMDHDDEFRGIILTRADGAISRLADLKGAAVSFPAPTALAATLMPELYLKRHGVDPRRDIRQIFVGTHESAMVSVATGAAAAACTWPPAWDKFQKERPELAQKLKVRWRTEPMPNNGLIVRDDVPEAVRDKVAQALFGLKDSPEGRELLEALPCQGFVPAGPEDFLPVRDFIGQYERAVRPLQGLHE